MSKDILTLAREAGARPQQNKNCDVEYLMSAEALERFAELVRADERNSWPAEMEAMERQVNILTDALNDRQRWFDALEAQHKQAILAEREACAKVCEAEWSNVAERMYGEECATAIRARKDNT